MEKEQQHYVPKFYLKNFSFEGKAKEIGIFNLNSNFFLQNGKLKTQCRKPYFYGKDGSLETALSDFENLASPILANVIKTGVLPSAGTTEHHTILYFSILSELRIPVCINSIKTAHEHLQKRINETEIDSNSTVFSAIPETTHEESIAIAFSSLERSFSVMQDLAYKIILNQSKTPFITSDNPVVVYNQYLEKKQALLGNSGHAVQGIQMFLPLCDDKIIMFYDRDVYKVGDKKKRYIELSKKTDIDQLNLLQILNCHQLIYFNHKALYPDLILLKKKSQSYLKGNQMSSTILKQIDQEGKINNKESLILLGSQGIRINLSLPNIHQTKKIKRRHFDYSRLALRPQTIPIIEKFSSFYKPSQIASEIRQKSDYYHPYTK
jgi:hypothetical protein